MKQFEDEINQLRFKLKRTEDDNVKRCAEIDQFRS